MWPRARRLALSCAALIAATVASAAPASTQGTIVLRGVDIQDPRPFTLSRDADVVWSCPGCAAANFTFDTVQVQSVINALNHTHGTSFLPHGHYTGVLVDGSGAWTITLRPARKRKTARSYVLTGVDGEYLKPLTITHTSTLTWSCPHCTESVFIFDTNQIQGIVNTGNTTHGTTTIYKGHYTGISVQAAGPWTITIH
jgi:hypothetical protein